VHSVPSDLKDLADLFADWAVPASGVTIYLFGSRVRGDHTSASDVDVCFRWENPGDADAHSWTSGNQDDFKAIKQKLPGPLKILEQHDPFWMRVVATEIVYQDRNVRCVRLPPKPK
jgi:hypothetical protein